MKNIFEQQLKAIEPTNKVLILHIISFRYNLCITISMTSWTVWVSNWQMTSNFQIVPT